jgi:KaiC/GvpD/RAD55 family RecA-like ATPase
MVKKSKLKKIQSPTTPKEDLVDRVITGVEGFDELIEGGIPRSSFILLSGGTGTGKSIFGMNFLAHGANNGEPGIYVSLEEGYEENKLQMGLFGWDLDQFQKEKKLMILQPKIYNFDKLLESIQNAIYSIKAKRVVIDSISILELYFEDKFKTRRNILDLAKTIRAMGVTTLAIAEIDDVTGGISREGVEEFVADGVIILFLDKKENMLNRAISVRKMRATNHSLKIHPLKIKRPGGVIVYPFEETFNEF